VYCGHLVILERGNNDNCVINCTVLSDCERFLYAFYCNVISVLLLISYVASFKLIAPRFMVICHCCFNCVTVHIPFVEMLLVARQHISTFDLTYHCDF